jgi:hypothetical protein
VVERRSQSTSYRKPTTRRDRLQKLPKAPGGFAVNIKIAFNLVDTAKGPLVGLAIRLYLYAEGPLRTG